MSFSSEVKKELISQNAQPRHCTVAELAGMLGGAGRIQMEKDQLHIVFTSENEKITQKYARLVMSVIPASTIICQIPRRSRVYTSKNLANENARGYSSIEINMSQAYHIQQKSKTSYFVDIINEEAEKLLQILKILKFQDMQVPVSRLLLQKSCCKRAFLRGFFLAAGSMSDPKKSYHFEIVCENIQMAKQVQEQFGYFELEAKIVSRKNHEIVYLKEGAQIVDALNIMGAHMALMDLENVRILKEMRNDINRRVNCETANINKTVSAAYRQQQAIRFLQQQGALSGLPGPLQEIAALRMEYPEAAIQELGTLCDPKVGKSGVNHRLRKLEEIAGHMGYVKKE